MSRIGKQPISLPEDVDVKIDNHFLIIKGPKGELKRETRPEIKIEINKENKEITLSPLRKTKKTKAFWGLERSLLFNMVEGVKKGFEKKLELIGIGFKAALSGNKLVLNLGFSHPIEYEIPQGIEIKVEKNIITVSGIDKQLVGQVSAKIRSFKKPEPYKGKGIKYLDEIVKRKPGKKATGEGK